MGRKSTRKPRSNKKEKVSLDISDKFLDFPSDKVLDTSEKVMLDSSEKVTLDSSENTLVDSSEKTSLDLSEKASSDSKYCDAGNPSEEFSEEETEREVITISDDENEIDSLLEEFMKEEAKVIHKSISKVILSSDDDDMEILLEEFSKDSSSNEKASEVKKKGRKTKKKISKRKSYD